MSIFPLFKSCLVFDLKNLIFLEMAESCWGVRDDRKKNGGALYLRKKDKKICIFAF